MKQIKSNQIKAFALIGVFSGMYLLGGCVSEDDVRLEEAVALESLSLSTAEVNQVEIAKEFSQMLGEVLQAKEARIELSQLIKHVDSFGDAVTLAAILGDKASMSSSELNLLNNVDQNPKLRKGLSHLSEILLEHSLANMSKYELIQKSFDSHLLTLARVNSNISPTQALKDFYSTQGLIVHIPYEEKFDWESDGNIITMTYDPIVREDWNEGFVYTTNANARISGPNGQVISMVDDDYSFGNPTFVITYFNEDDIMSTPPIPTLPTPVANAVILNFNVNHATISQSDLLFSTVPEIRLTGNGYRGLFGRYTKVRIFRGSNKLKVNFDGTIGSSADGETFRFNEVRFSKNEARNKLWKSVSFQFDPDWDMSENSQQLFLFTDHNLKSSAKAKLSAKVGYDFITKKPKAEVTGSVDVEVELRGSTFRSNSELSRKSVMAHIVGSTGLGTRNRNGHEYNIKAVGLVQFYFEHYFTDIPD